MSELSKKEISTKGSFITSGQLQEINKLVSQGYVISRISNDRGVLSISLLGQQAPEENSEKAS